MHIDPYNEIYTHYHIIKTHAKRSNKHFS